MKQTTPPLKRGRKHGAYGPYRHESHAGKVVLKLRDSHHRIAMLFASGLRTSEVALESGYSLSYISNLRGDPAMCDLIAYYHDHKVEPEYLRDISSFQGKLRRMREMATDQAIEHLEESNESGEKLRIRELLSMIGDSADRTGFGKHQIHEVKHTFAAQLDKAIAQSSSVIELRAASGGREATVEALPAPSAKIDTIVEPKTDIIEATIVSVVPAAKMRRL